MARFYVFNVLLFLQRFYCKNVGNRMIKQQITRSSATAEGSRDALFRLKCCQPLQNCTNKKC